MLIASDKCILEYQVFRVAVAYFIINFIKISKIYINSYYLETISYVS